jgi:hypothetical protein
MVFSIHSAAGAMWDFLVQNNLISDFVNQTAKAV